MPRLGLNDQDDEEMDLVDGNDAYAAISAQLAEFEGSDGSAKRALENSSASFQKKSVFSRAGFVRPAFGSPGGSVGSINSPGGEVASLSDFTRGGGGEGDGTLVVADAGNRDVVDDAEIACCRYGHDALKNLSSSWKGVASGEDDVAANSEFFRVLAESANGMAVSRSGAAQEDGKMERNVWSLMGKLCSEGVDNVLSVRPPEFEDSVPLDAIVSEVTRTPQEVLLNASDNDRLLRRRQIVLEWLESCAEEDIVFYDPSLRSRSSKPKMWPVTMKKTRKGKPFQIDLDLLEGTDGEDEASLLSSVFMMIRAGRVEDACELCARAGQPWRAASISGGYQMGARAEDGEDGGNVSFTGNPKFALWRRTCWKLCRARWGDGGGANEARCNVVGQISKRDV